MTEPSAGSPPAQPDDEKLVGPDADPVETADDAARHAVARPAPVPPGPAPTEVLPPAAAGDSTSAAVPGPTAPGTGAPGTAPSPSGNPPVLGEEPATPPQHAAAPAPPPAGAPAPVPPDGDTGFDFPDPHPPAAPGIWAHVLGVLVGLVLAPVGALALLLGQSRILVVQADHWDGDVEALGIALVAVGALLLAALALLGIWTAAAPITGGGALLLIGAPALLTPGFMSRQTLVLIDPEGWHATITQTVVAGTSGTLLLAGLLLLVAGLVAAAARRRGLRLGAFRERHRAG
ncbi:MAG: hypothetical protein L6367_03595 [Cellulomonas sp.]|nr:hypothetical protein [Cellulomonas sp.]